jgi:uncharacterized membrane protein
MSIEHKSGNRLAYIDWMRGFACLLMFQTHCYNSWLSAADRKTALYAYSQLGGTLPAPLFIFLAGLSFALVTEKLREKGIDRNAIARTTIRRGGEIYVLGLLFRIQEFVFGFPIAPWTDLFRVDVLNILGISMMLMGVLCWLTGSRAGAASPERAASGVAAGIRPAIISSTAARDTVSVTTSWLARSRDSAIVGGIIVAAVIGLVTPLVWTTTRFTSMPWQLETYLNGVHVFGHPQAWLFPIFPWVAFAFAGLAIGFFLFSDFAKKNQTKAFVGLGCAGVVASVLSVLFDKSRIRLYKPADYDYWHTSPNFLLMRCGILLVILFGAYAWCRWGFAQRGFSPVIQLGRTSLLVYWVHMEFVYGRLSILPKGKCGIAAATVGLIVIFLAMLALSIGKTNWKKREVKVSRARPPVEAAAEPV